jgi:hypothetical protein
MNQRVIFLPACLASLALGACGADGGNQPTRSGEADRIECALAGSEKFERVCITETMPGEKGRMLVVRHPDGGFRRFNILTDGRGLAPADGFDETTIKILGGGMIEVSSADDRKISGSKACVERGTRARRSGDRYRGNHSYCIAGRWGNRRRAACAFCRTRRSVESGWWTDPRAAP